MVVAAKTESIQKPQPLKKKANKNSTATTTATDSNSNSNSEDNNDVVNPTRPPVRPRQNNEKTTTKIHAQRKFAQGASITFGHSPVKHVKISAKKRVVEKRAVSPQFIPTKRPKTEDFLTFLCYRGTPVLPAELDVFNHPPSSEATSSGGKNEAVNNTKKSEETPEKKVVQSPTIEPSPRASASSNNASSSSSNRKSKDKSAINTPSKPSTNSQGASETNGPRKSPGLKRIPDVMVVVKQAEKAIAAFGNVRKDLTAALKPNRINEQDARFAMTALKLKYQEKRLAAKSKPTSSIAVASKIKGRNVILTRSKAHSLPSRSNKQPKFALKKKPKLIAQKLRKESPSQSRNAPSPDIIYGMIHSKNAVKQTSAPSNSSSKSNSDSEISSSSSSEESNDSSDSSSESDEDKTPVVRSLRNGKEVSVVSQPNKKPTKTTKSSSKPAEPSRVSTRSARRISTSPLRELPMYGVQKRKPKKSGLKKNTKQKDESDSLSHRPMRKTKETASICLGLINNFSSDEENSTDKVVDDADSSGSSSSSETQYLEKQYNASMKRKEQSENSKSKKPSTKAKPGNKKEVPIKSKTKPSNPPKKPSIAAGKKAPGKRILRSQSSRESGAKQKSEVGRVVTRRFSVPVGNNDRAPEGAARKSASVYPRRRGSYYSSSSESDESDTTEEEESSGDEKSSAESTTSVPEKTPAPKSVSRSKSTLAARKSASSSPMKAPPPKDAKSNKEPPRKRQQKTDTSKAPKQVKNRSVSRDSENDEQDKNTSELKKVIIEIQRDEPSEESSEEAEESEEETTSSEEEDKPVVEKTSIAIQVDMDSEENVDMNQLYASPPPESVSSETSPPPSSSSGTYTEMPSFMSSINIAPHPSMPFVPFSSQGPSFYPTLHLTPPVVSNIHVLTRGTHEFSLAHPGVTMSIPASMPMHNYGGHLLQPSTMCFSSTSISAATLQTHIRSVAANLDIPLVRPIIGSDPLHIPFPRVPSVSTNGAPGGAPMTRPVPVWQGDTRPHSSAFRVPVNTTNDSKIGNYRTPMPNNLLPLSIVQPQGQQQSGILPPSASTSNSQQTNCAGGLRKNIPGATPNTPGYSILQNLPNVSIVPRFDRSSKPVVCPPDQEALERKLKNDRTAEAASSNSNGCSSGKNRDKDKKGSKRKKGSVIPHPSSPLTVRKDSANPVTYGGGTSKKVSRDYSSEEDKKSVESTKESSSDPFIKLLQMKKTNSDGTSSKNSVNHKLNSHSQQTASPSLKEPKKEENYDAYPTEEKFKATESSRKMPQACSNGESVEAPTFCPTEEQFQDPLKYIEKIRPEAENFGMARIIPPRSFRPDCNVDDDMRFTAYNHYIHKMFQRWGPNVHETMAIKEHLRNTDVDTSSVPLIGGMEVDLCTLYHTVQSLGGLKETIEKQKWNKVSDAMHIPKAANDRVSKLDSVYVKYVLPYETLSETERKRLLSKVERNWNARQEKLRKRAEKSESESSDDEDPLEEVDDCIIKGKNTPLTSYYRVARNTKSMLFPSTEPTCSEVEEEYWKMVRKRTRHLCVYSGSIDCAGVGWGFPLPKASNKHPWNLKVLANSPGSVLRSMGPVMGATVPTLHVGMVFTTYCWYRDPHGLPWIEYLHSGDNKIWYVIPASEEEKFRKVLKEVMPLQCKNKKLWLSSDSAMVPPEVLREKGVSLYRTVQNPGEFLVVFPKAFTSAICTGYVVSESVCFAPVEWLDTAPQTFDDIKSSKEPPVFALEKLLLSIVQDHKISTDILKRVYGPMERILKEEFVLRKRLMDLGVRTGKLCRKTNAEEASKKKRKQEDEALQCDNCNYILHLSLVNNETREFTYCLRHAVEYLLQHKSHVKTSVLRFDYTQEELTASMTEVSNRLSSS